MIDPTYDDGICRVYLGDSLALLPELDEYSVDAVVTDPPYGLGFMGKDWDSPGGTGDFPMRRFHAINMVNTGASRQGGRQRSTEDFQKRQARDARSYQEWCEQWAKECLRVLKPGGHLLAFGGTRTVHRLASAIEDAGFEIRDTIAWLYGSGFPKSRNLDGDWQGWGTALKPANEPIVVARKSLIGTVLANVTEYSTGAINIDGCRVETTDDLNGGAYTGALRQRDEYTSTDTEDGAVPLSRLNRGIGEFAQPSGRWPTNVVLDPEAANALDEQTGVLTSGLFKGTRTSDKTRSTYGAFKGDPERETETYGDSGGASRFFPTFRYEAKAGDDERPRIGELTHPTIKPVDLMRWLVRLVTPPDGLVLDPFLGSGTTAEACVREGLRCIGIEREEDYMQLIETRLTKGIQIGFAL